MSGTRDLVNPRWMYLKGGLLLEDYDNFDSN